MEKERRTEDGYWQERDSQFVLHIDGTERAIVNRSANTGVILSMPGEPGYKFTAPDSQTVFDAVEQRLGIGRIEEFRTAQGMRTIIPWRDMAENHAEWSRSNHPPGKEAEHYTQQAWNLLNHKSTAGGLTNQANDARFILGKVLVSLERDQGQWRGETRQQLQAARDLLRQGPESPGEMLQPEASHQCEKALAALDLERGRDAAPASINDRVKARLSKIKEQERQGKERTDDRERD